MSSSSSSSSASSSRDDSSEEDASSNESAAQERQDMTEEETSDDSSNDVNGESDYTGDEDEDGDGDDEVFLPLAERLERAKKSETTSAIDMDAFRERKHQARQLAKERLALRKKEQHGEGGKKEPAVEKKPSKHAPTEISSKRSDFMKQSRTTATLRGVGVKLKAGYKPMDPRLSSMHGLLNVDHFERNYEFLQELRDKEIQQLRERVAAYKVKGQRGQRLRKKLGITKTDAALEEDRAKLKQLEQQKADFARSQIERAAKRSVKKKLQQEVAEGKRSAYFLKRNEKKRLELEAKYEEIRKRGGDAAVDKAVAKRRKKNKSRDASRFGSRRDE